MKRLAISLLLLTSLVATCPMQGKTIVAKLEKSMNEYHLTFMAVSEAPTYVQKNAGTYKLPEPESDGIPFYCQYGSKIVSVTFDKSLKNEKPTSTAGWLCDMSNLKSANLKGIENLNTTEVTNMREMFSHCSSLTFLSLKWLNTAKVTNMKSMFNGCSGLTSLDVTKFNTSNVTDMSRMFMGCSGLKSLDVTKFNTSNVTNMGNMFDGCSGLTSLDVSNFDTQNVTSTDYMFSDCSKLTSLDVSKFNTSKVIDMEYMFYNCKSLNSLDVSNFDTKNVKRMGCMFRSCHVRKLDVSKFDTSNVWDMGGMFWNCPVESLNVSNFNTSKVTNMNYMFENCTNLTTLDLSSFVINNDAADAAGNVMGINEMLFGCENLMELNLGSNDLTVIYWKFRERPAGCIGKHGTKPCHLTFSFDKSKLGPVISSKIGQCPPYYYCDGYFTIADTLDSETDYTFQPSIHKSANKGESDLWVKARTLKANVWNTLVIPAGTTQAQLKEAFGDDVQVCYIYSYTNDKLTFKTLEGETKANMPILVKPSTDIKNVGFANVELEQPGDLTWTTQDVDGSEHYASFIGSYKQSITIGADCYYYYDGKFLRSAGGSTVRNTRGYFKFSDITADSQGTAKQFVLDDGTGNATAIDAIDGELVNGHAPAYNLSGQRVGDDYRGIVIVKGKKYLRK